MRVHHIRALIAIVAIWIVGALSLSAAPPADSRRDADQFKQKLTAISERSSVTRLERVTTVVSERELNAYLALELAKDLPTGIVNPSLTMPGNERVTARAVVDLDQVRQKRASTSLLDPLRYLSGSLAVRASGVIHARDGLGRFELEAADIEGVPIPKLLLQQIVSHYSRSAARPAGFSLDDAVTLPAEIREIRAERERAVIVQERN